MGGGHEGGAQPQASATTKLQRTATNHKRHPNNKPQYKPQHQSNPTQPNTQPINQSLQSNTTRHGCPDLCINVVNNMYGYNAMEVQEAFVKIREQVS